MTRLSAQITYLRTGERAMLTQLQSSRPPGSSDLAPEWAVSAARDCAKSLFQQVGRVRASGAPSAGGGNDDAAPMARRRRNRAGGKPTASATGGGSAASSSQGGKGPPGGKKPE